MDFWMVFLCICLSFVLLEAVVDKKYRNIVATCFMIFITFISAFRYRIGYDYQSYEVLFYNAEIENISMEPTFTFLVTFLREAGFAPQAMFAIYSILTYLFVWKGLKYYLPDVSLSLKILLLVINTITWAPYYWTAIGSIRQALAISIFFWCSKYIIEKKLLKYTLGIILATACHYSAIVLIIVYYIIDKHFNKYLSIMLIISCFFSYYTHFIQNIFSVMLSYFDFYTAYTHANNEIGSIVIGISLFTEITFWFLIMFFRKNTNKEREIMINAYTLSFVIFLLFAWSGALTRFTQYFAIFRGLVILDFIERFRCNSKNIVEVIVILCLSILFLRFIYIIIPSSASVRPDILSGGNIDYTFNFLLFQ